MVAMAMFALATVARAQPVVFEDMGSPSFPTTLSGVVNLAPGQIKWYRITLPEVSPDGYHFVDITTAAGTVEPLSNGNTEIGLYRNDGTLVAWDDDDGPGSYSSLTFGLTSPPRTNPGGFSHDGRDGGLAAGTYWLSVSAFNTQFFPDGWSVTSSSTSTGTVSVSITLGALTGPAVFEDLGSPSVPMTMSLVPNLASGEVKWYRITLPDISGSVYRFLDITTAAGSVQPLSSGNTEIGLYRNNGTRVATDDDDGPGSYSSLTFGLTSPPRTNPSGLPHNGRDGGLAAGTYWLCVSAYNTTHGSAAWSVTSPSTSAGTVSVSITLGALSGPAVFEDLSSLFFPGTYSLVPNLASGEVKWYRITLPAVSAAVSTYLDITTKADTAGTALSGGNTEIGLYRADGTLVATDDDDGPGSYSSLSFGESTPNRNDPAGAELQDGRDGILAAGTYWLCVSAFDTTYGSSEWSVTTTSNATGTVGITINLGRMSFEDLGSPSFPSTIYRVPNLADCEIRWYRITLPEVSPGTSRFMDITTDDSGDPVSIGDTEIGLYRNDGTLVEHDDDYGPGYYSSLSFGQTSPIRANAGDGVPHDGRDGVLPAGTYWLCVGAYNMTFGSSGWSVTSSSLDDGSAAVSISLGTADACPADFNADGFLDFTDFDAFVAAFEAGGTAADFNADGFIDFTDFDAYVTAFEAGC